jgi:hypothetical protein
VLLLASVALGATASAATTQGPRAATQPAVFGIGPSSATKVDGRPYYYYLTQPGAAFSDHVAVVNVGLAPITLSIYPTDATNSSSDGSFAFPAAAVKPADAGTWIHVQLPHGATTITLHGRSSVFLPVTVSVPASASPGDHGGAIIASLEGQVRNSNGQLIHLDQRVATRVFVRVSGPLRPQLSIEDLHASYHGSWSPFARGQTTVTYTVHNTGNVKLGGAQVVSVSGLFGSVRAADAPAIPLLLPGGSVQESVVVPGVLPQVRMSATVTVQPAGLTGDVNPSAATVTATTQFWALPSWLLLLLLLLLVLGLLGYERRRHRRQPAGGQGPQASPDRPAPPGPGGPAHDEEQVPA